MAGYLDDQRHPLALAVYHSFHTLLLSRRIHHVLTTRRTCWFLWSRAISIPHSSSSPHTLHLGTRRATHSKVPDIIELACLLPRSMERIVLLHAEVHTYVCRQYPVYPDHTLPGSASRDVRVTEEDASLHAAALLRELCASGF